MKNLNTEFVHPSITILHQVERVDSDGDVWFELELKNHSETPIWGVEAQVLYHDKAGEFMGFKADDHEGYLMPGRSKAFAICHDLMAKADQARLSIDANIKEDDSPKTKTELVVVLFTLVAFMGGLFVAKNFF